MLGKGYRICTAAGVILAEGHTWEKAGYFLCCLSDRQRICRIRTPDSLYCAEFSLNEQGCLHIWPLINRLTAFLAAPRDLVIGLPSLPECTKACDSGDGVLRVDT